MGGLGPETASVHGERLVLPIPHFAVLTLRGIAYARWMNRLVPIDLSADGMPALPEPLHQPLPPVHYWPVYSRLDSEDLHGIDGTNALLAARDLAHRYLLDDHLSPSLGAIELEPTHGDVHYVHPGLLAHELGVISAQAMMIVRYDFSDLSHTIIRPLPGLGGPDAGNV